ncbi:MAG TPA: hypothetical protein PK390_07845 [Fervidobacterium nodosum]|nr:hypothetical protein [Fervidobacterium nodosum]
MHEYIEKYGKEFIRDILDIIIIKENKVTDEDFRKILIKNKIIKPSTKFVYHTIYHSDILRNWYIIAENGRGTIILDLTFNDSELPILFSELQ